MAIGTYFNRIKNRLLAEVGFGPLQLLVLQPTPFCNLACRYCYLSDKDNKAKMSEATLEQSLKWVKATGLLGTHCDIAWHAGDPLVLGVDWFRSAFDIVESEMTGTDVSHSFQTNGTLISDEWCRFIKERRNVHVGVSIDGPPRYHNLNRVTRAGRPTHEQVMGGIRLLQRHEIPFQVICVLTAESVRDPKGMFEFFRDNGIFHLGFNVEEIEGRNATSSLSDGVGEEDFAQFFTQMILLSQECPQMHLREVLNIIRQFPIPKSGSGYRGQSQVTPFQILSISYKGDLSTFSPELLGQKSQEYSDFVLGNVYDDSLTSLLGGSTFQRLNREVSEGVTCQCDGQ